MDDIGHTTVRRSPHCRLAEVPVGAVAWTEGFWAQRFRLCHHTVLPGLKELENDHVSGWTVIGQNGKRLMEAGNIQDHVTPVILMFPPDISSWSVMLYPFTSGLFDTLFKAGRGLYLYIFIAIVFVLVCGLLFTLLTFNNMLNLSRTRCSEYLHEMGINGVLVSELKCRKKFYKIRQ